MNSVLVGDKRFEKFIGNDEISIAVADMADKINSDLMGKDVVFLCVLNGAFVFAADLLRKISLKCNVSFLKYSSYEGTSSSGTINEVLALNEDIKNKTVVIIEDIIDSGLTIERIVSDLKRYSPDEIRVAALLVKPHNFRKNIKVHYTGFEIPNDFIVGYGLDYNGFGRNLEDIYTLTE